MQLDAFMDMSSHPVHGNHGGAWLWPMHRMGAHEEKFIFRDMQLDALLA